MGYPSLTEVSPGSGVYCAKFGEMLVEIERLQKNAFNVSVTDSVESMEAGRITTVSLYLDLNGPIKPIAFARIFGHTLDAALARNPKDVDQLLLSGLSVPGDDVCQVIMPASSLLEALSCGCPISDIDPSGFKVRHETLELANGRAWSIVDIWKDANILYHAYSEIQKLWRVWGAGMLVEPPVMWAHTSSDDSLLGVLILWEEAPEEELIQAALNIGGNPGMDVAMCAERAIYLPVTPGILPGIDEFTVLLANRGLWVSDIIVSGVLCQSACLDLMPTTITLQYA